MKNVFHEHLDVCQRCRDKPFDLCEVGYQALCEAAEVGGRAGWVARSEMLRRVPTPQFGLERAAEDARAITEVAVASGDLQAAKLKKLYEKPELIEYGNVVDLTKGFGGSKSDAGPSGKSGS